METLLALLEGPTDNRRLLADLIQSDHLWGALRPLLDRQYVAISSQMVDDVNRGRLFKPYLFVRTVALDSLTWASRLDDWGAEGAEKAGENYHAVLDKMVGSIEIARNGKSEKVLFPLPEQVTVWLYACVCGCVRV